MKSNIIDYNSLSIALKQRIYPEDITSSNLINIIPDVLEVVEKTNTPGELKKKFAKSLIEQLIKEADIDNDDKTKCMELLSNGIVDSSIENIIRVSKKKYKVNYKSNLQKFIIHRIKSNAANKISLITSSNKIRSRD